MNLQDRHVVVTGAASGIGRAMALRFAAEGARGIVVADLDRDGACVVAAQIGPRALPVGCDVGSDAGTLALIDEAEAAFGPVDLFCANAGIGAGSDVDTSDADWDRSFAVNVRSHISAARRLVPDWVARGEGYLLVTASAAGLLTQIGAAPYAVTKNAAVAFAEWLSITYGDRGVRVSCLCPMGVNTPLLADGMELPGAAGAGLRHVARMGAVLEPEDVAASVVDGLAREQFLILPHPEVQQFVTQKAADRERWLAGMRGLQAQQMEAMIDG
jgi:NAD(P)-dependent dehydrogenase (short-subunit alcohol dehydrogenase family)